MPRRKPSTQELYFKTMSSKYSRDIKMRRNKGLGQHQEVPDDSKATFGQIPVHGRSSTPDNHSSPKACHSRNLSPQALDSRDGDLLNSSHCLTMQYDPVNGRVDDEQSSTFDECEDNLDMPYNSTPTGSVALSDSDNESVEGLDDQSLISSGRLPICDQDIPEDDDWDGGIDDETYKRKFLTSAPVNGEIAFRLLAQKHKISKAAVGDILKLFEIVRVEKHSLVASNFLLEQQLRNYNAIASKTLTVCGFCSSLRPHCKDYSDHCNQCSGNASVQRQKRSKANQIVVFSLVDSLQQVVLLNPKLFNSHVNDNGAEKSTSNSLMNGDVYKHLHYKSDQQSKYPYRLTFLLNYDDGQLRKSVDVKVSPISFVIAELDSESRLNRTNVMTAGFWVGYGKPNTQLLWKLCFWDQYKRIKNRLVQLFDRDGNIFEFSVDVVGLVADQPAVSATMLHTYTGGYYGCTWCTIRTEFIPCEFDPKNPKRKKEKQARAYKYQTQFKPKESYQELCKQKPNNFGVLGDSIAHNFLARVPDMIPRDVMHLVYEGVVKKFISLVVPQKKNAESSIDAFLSEIATPHDIARKPRGIATVKFWKASEFKFFLFYYFPVFKNIISEEKFILFASLSVLIRLLSSRRMELSNANLNFAQMLADRFYFHYERVFGPRNCTSNIHGLIHLPTQARLFGNCSNTSTFAFEDNIGVAQGFAKGTRNFAGQIADAYLAMKGVSLQFKDKEVPKLNRLAKFVDKFMTSSYEKKSIQYRDVAAIGCVTIRLSSEPTLVKMAKKKLINGYVFKRNGIEYVNICDRVIFDGFEYHSRRYQKSRGRLNSSNSSSVEYSDDNKQAQMADILFYLLPPEADEKRVKCIAQEWRSKPSKLFSGMEDVSSNQMKDLFGKNAKKRSDFSDLLDSFFWRIEETDRIITFWTDKITFRVIKFHIKDNYGEIATVVDHTFESS